MENRTIGSTIYGLFWLINFVYTCIFVGGWHILGNFFIPYSMIVEFFTHHGYFAR